MDTMKSTVTNLNQRGSTLVPVMVLVTVLGALGYFLPDLYIRAQKRTVQTERSLKIQNIASNLKELGKFLILYEKVFYINDPLNLDPGRVAAQQELWGQTFGNWSTKSNHHMINACGGFDALANFTGDMKLNGEPVLCTNYIKSTLLSGKMLEDMVLEKWTQTGQARLIKVTGGRIGSSTGTRAKVLDGGNGHYKLKIDMTDALYDAGRQAFDPVMDANLRSELKSVDAKAEIMVEFFTDSFGFEMPGPERFIRVTGQVTFDDGLGRNTLTEQETFVMHTPLVKDFSLFIPFPTDVNGDKVPNFSQALRLGGSGTNIYGRVYFNGNIDVPLEDLPVFHETVIISGKFLPSDPKPSQIDLVRRKFRKGVITNFDAHKYILDGDCGKPSVNKNIQNESSILCGSDIKEQVGRTQNDCRWYEVIVGSNGKYFYNFSNKDIPQGVPQPPAPALACVPTTFVELGRKKVVVNGQVAFIASAIENLKVNSRAHLYGVVLGGHVNVPDGTTFVALPYLKPGMPGIPSQVILDQISMEASAASGGVESRIMNLPLIEDSFGGLK